MTRVVADRVRPTTAEFEPAGLEHQLDQHRGELTGYCYRMLGSAFDAEDAVQDTLLRAWRAADQFEGRSALRSWLYRIATNVCLDMLGSRKRRALPMDLSSTPFPPVETSLGPPLSERTWVEPIPDGPVTSATADPAEVAVARESIRLAFVAALQHLPPRQRAVLILRDVLRWKADEVAELLDATVASTNSALQRARSSMAARDLTTSRPLDPLDAQDTALLARYIDAFERYDVEALVSVLHEDATQAMPPYLLWLQGPVDIGRWMVGPGIGCKGSRLVPVTANGSPALAQYHPGSRAGRCEPFAIHVFEVSDGRITSILNFLDLRLFPLFGLPPHLEG
jgi:RNA polymerase sigma-70 factor (ECF subfamily)